MVLVGTYDPVPGETSYGLPVYKKRGIEMWLQCSPYITNWLLQSSDNRNTMHCSGQSPSFCNIYECKLPHELIGQKWSIPTKDYEDWIEIDVNIFMVSTFVTPEHGE